MNAGPHGGSGPASGTGTQMSPARGSHLANNRFLSHPPGSILPDVMLLVSGSDFISRVILLGGGRGGGRGHPAGGQKATMASHLRLLQILAVAFL